MNTKTKSLNLLVGSMLFGLFFGAGNLIFPVQVGQQAGGNVILATIGFLLTGTGIPFLGIVAMGISGADNTIQLGSRVSKFYGYAITVLLYLTIGPLFALPRTATVSFEVGFTPNLQENQIKLALFIFTFLFFSVALFFALRPTRILDWVGKFLNPIFLLFLAFLFIKAALNPMGKAVLATVAEGYKAAPLVSGAIGGYQTMDVLAALAFGSIVVDAIKSFGITKPKEVAKNAIKSGLVTLALMGVIYGGLTWLGATSTGVLGLFPNGGLALAAISKHYLGSFGSIFLAVTITVACLKTAIGLITACAKVFGEMLPFKIGYNIYAIFFAGFSFLVSNVGLSQIITLAVPMLMFLYPLAITLVFLSLFHNFFGGSRAVYISVTIGALFVSIGDLLKALLEVLPNASIIKPIVSLYTKYIPFFDIGMGWIIPSAIGFIIGFVLTKTVLKKSTM